MDAIELRAFRRRKAWRRLLKAGRAPVVSVSWFWCLALMLWSGFMGCVLGVWVVLIVMDAWFRCVPVSVWR